MKLSIITPAAALAMLVLAVACKKEEPANDAVALTTANAAPAPKSEAQPPVERGRYLVTTSGCHDCHTPLKMGANGPEPDMSRGLSGHPSSLVMPPAPELPPGPWLVTVSATNTAWAGPWGVSYTANLTPDDETGLGKWTKDNFIAALRSGRHMGAGRPILPPMPAAVYAKMTDEDLGAMYDYLRTVPAISNKVPAPLPPKK